MERTTEQVSKFLGAGTVGQSQEIHLPGHPVSPELSEPWTRGTTSDELDDMIERSRIYQSELCRLKDLFEAQEAYRRVIEAARRYDMVARTERTNRPWSFAPNEILSPAPAIDVNIRMDSIDIEKARQLIETVIVEESPPATEGGALSKRLYRFFITNVLEKRGIERVEPYERHDLTFFGFNQMSILWFSMNLAANNIALGMLGPAVFGLGFLDSCMCAIFGMLLGSLPVAWIAITGPRSGLRTMVWSRYTTGWYLAKVVVILNIVELLGYCMIDAVIAGQMLSAVSPHESLTIVAGIFIVSAITLMITTFGYSVFHYYERYAWWPQMAALCILAGVAGPDFNISSRSLGTASTIAANRLSFFSLCLSAAITYSGCAGSFFVYYPNTLPAVKVFSTAFLGLSLSFAFTFVLGIGLGSGALLKPAWAAAYATSEGALIVKAFAPLGRFGSVCGVIVALGLVSNVIPTAYASAIDFQMLGRWCAHTPRVAWNAAGIAVLTICAAAGRKNLAAVFTNFLALMGYWCSIWIALVLEEEFVFRRRGMVPAAPHPSPDEIVEIVSSGASERTEDVDGGYDWTLWNQRECLPFGLAATAAFTTGWAGAVLCMAQKWYVGPIARLVGKHGGDMGNYVGFTLAAAIYPPLRKLELKRFKR